MKMRLIIFIQILVLSMSSCFDVFEWTSWEEGNYYVITSPSQPRCENLYIKVSDNGGIGRLNCIERLGSNGEFIIAKSGQGYWILDINKDDKLLNADEIMEGPLNEESFNQRKREMGISEIEFSQSF